MSEEKRIETQETLTDEQVDAIAEDLQSVVKGTALEDIANLPSNQGVQETAPENREKGEQKKMAVTIDPSTGEQKILGQAPDSVDTETFEEMCERIQNQEIKLDQTPITEKEIIEQISSGKGESVFSEITKDIDLSEDATRVLLNIVNRRMKKEQFNIYREFPDELKLMVDRYMLAAQVPVNSKQGKQYRNTLSEYLIDEFIQTISVDRALTDFNKELESLFEKGSSEIADTIVGYSEERNRKYREYADKMEDPEKREKVLAILDRIDEGYNLIELKEFAKKCKIKKFDLEKPQKYYNSFLGKYASSSYNIYHIDNARQVLYRNLNQTGEEFSVKDVDAFFVCFCKQCRDFKPEVVTEHAYMYYVLYNIVLIDANKGEQKGVSDTYLNNIKEVIYNLRVRNNNFQ